MAAAMVAGQPVPSAVQPPDLSKRQISLLPPVVLDAVPPGSKFGAVVKDVRGSYQAGDTVSATFR
jgi:neutral ceramidase